MSTVLEKELDLYRAQSEAWKTDHQNAMLYYDVREAFNLGLHIYQSISDLDTDVQSDIFAKRFDRAAGEAFQAKILDLYRSWMNTSERFGPIAQYMAGIGHPVDEEWGRLQECMCEVRGILTPDHAFFAGERLVDLRDKAIDEHRRGEAAELRGIGD